MKTVLMFIILGSLLSSCARPETVCECYIRNSLGRYNFLLERRIKWHDAEKKCVEVHKAHIARYDTCLAKEIR